MSKSKNSLLKSMLVSSGVIVVGLLLGRMSGFVRESFVAATYGVSAKADLIVLMLTVPDLMVNILVGGGISAALIPEFMEFPKQAKQLLYQAMLFFGLIFLILACLFYLRTDLLVSLLAPGFKDDQAMQASIALGRVIWVIPITVLAGIVTAYLHASNKFLMPSLGTLMINISIITGLMLVASGVGSFAYIAYAVLFGGFLRFFSQLLCVRISWKPIEGLIPKRLNQKIMVRYFQAMMSTSALLFFPVIARAMASYQGDGSVALFNYSMRLIEFPLAIAVTFLSSVFFPRISKSYFSDMELHRQLIRNGVQITLGLATVATISLISISDVYAAIVYGYGNMSDSSLSGVVKLTALGLLALPFQGLSSFLTAVYNARKNTRTPLIINFTGLIFYIISYNIGQFGSGLKALMIGLIVSYGLICFLQLLFLKIEYFSWWRVLFDREFLPGLVLAGALLVFGGHWVNYFIFSNWLALGLIFTLALVSLIIILLFNKGLRAQLKTRLGVG
jgi:putative peptidoglycan lipid II flippase